MRGFFVFQIEFVVAAMNIFATFDCPIQSARAHCDVHVIKMILESAQLLSAVHVLTTGEQVAYKLSHANHPCTIWVLESAENYRWLFEMFLALLREYEYRFDKVHKTDTHVEALRRVPVPLPEIGLTPFAQAIPEELRGRCAHDAYKRHIIRKMQEWPRRVKPMRTCFTRRRPPVFLKKLCPYKSADTKGTKMNVLPERKLKSVVLRDGRSHHYNHNRHMRVSILSVA